MTIKKTKPQGTFLFIGDFFIANYDWQKRMPFFQIYNFGVMDEKGESTFKLDGLNLTPEAYDRWARSILEYVSFLFEED